MENNVSKNNYLDIVNGLLTRKEELEKNDKVLLYKSLEFDCYFFGPKGNIGKPFADREHEHPSYPDILEEHSKTVTPILWALKEEDETVKEYIDTLNELAKFIYLYAEENDRIQHQGITR